VTCLLSSEQAENIAWGDAAGVDDTSNPEQSDYEFRMFDFEVSETKEQEENIIERLGISVCILSNSIGWITLFIHAYR